MEIEAKEESPTAVVTYSYSVESGQFKYRFDAKSSLAAIEGSLEGATYRWIFEDGTELMGAEIEKIFSSSGSKSVTLIVTDKEGRTGTIRKEGVYVYDTTILNTDFESPLPRNAIWVPNPGQSELDAVTESVSSNSIVRVGGPHGHIYLNKDAPEYRQIATTNQLEATLDVANLDFKERKPLSVLTQHGSWYITLLPDYSLQVTIGNTSQRFKAEALKREGWHNITIKLDKQTLSISIDKREIAKQNLSVEQANKIFGHNTYGIAIGGSGPWASANALNSFAIDNLRISSIIQSV